MEELLIDLLEGEVTKSIFWKVGSKKPVTLTSGLKKILHKISKVFKGDIEQLEEFFSIPLNPLDPTDTINPENITWESFKKRLETLLTKAMGVSYTQGDITWTEDDSSKQEFSDSPEQSSINILKRPLINAVIESSDYKQIKSLVTTPKVLTKSSTMNEKYEKNVNTSLISDSRRYHKGNWIEPYLNIYASDIELIFQSKVSNQSNMIEAHELKGMLRDMLWLMKLPQDKDLFLFDRMIENRFKHTQNKSQTKYLKLTYSQCIDLIEEWASKESLNRLSYESQMLNTIEEYTDLIPNMKSDSDLSSHLYDLIENLKLINTSFSSKSYYKSAPETLIEKQVKGLKEIFSFYASQYKGIGKSPTFDQITTHKQVLNVSKFIKFCNDFGIIGKKGSQRLTIPQVSQIFVNNQNCTRTMDLTQFLSAVENIAEQFWAAQMSGISENEIKDIGLTKKRQLLYQYLQCDDPNTYNQKLKGFGLPFSMEQAGYRIPEYDLSKKYKFKDQSIVKQRINEWKQQKEDEKPKRSSSVPIGVRINAIRMRLMQRKDKITWNELRNMEHESFINADELKGILTEDDIKSAM
ncbi:unnamed protein product [Blepharisma stoltei]|uniref:Uncharacterized protein n=1 Tax=Blepharisma stoltei TaxID=1481888 RepID=A0AAU9KC66_9CILI|nr:unnamed protein product [Blepharisma stoltei]